MGSWWLHTAYSIILCHDKLSKLKNHVNNFVISRIWIFWFSWMISWDLNIQFVCFRPKFFYSVTLRVIRWGGLVVIILLIAKFIKTHGSVLCCAVRTFKDSPTFFIFSFFFWLISTCKKGYRAVLVPYMVWIHVSMAEL